MKQIIIMAASLFLSLTSYSQTKNLQVEGSDNQIAVIRTTSTGNSYSGIDLLRGNAFNSTDWRIANVGGTLEFLSTINDFTTVGEDRLSIAPDGTMTLLGGESAELGTNTGILILGDSQGFNLGIDHNGIIARNGSLADELLLQTGPGMGDTYMNNLSGDVGIGTILPRAKLSVQNEGWQLHLKNADDNDSDWYIGSSRSEWSVGEDKLVFSPTSGSSDAMLILNNGDNVISTRGNRVTQVADPINDQDAVNLQTLEANLKSLQEQSSRLPRPRDLSPSSPNDMTFAECATYCRDLVQIKADDWKIPSIDELSYWAGSPAYTSEYWTTSTGSYSHAYAPFDELTIYSSDIRYTLRLSDAYVDRAQNGQTHRCVCVR